MRDVNIVRTFATIKRDVNIVEASMVEVDYLIRGWPEARPGRPRPGHRPGAGRSFRIAKTMRVEREEYEQIALFYPHRLEQRGNSLRGYTGKGKLSLLREGLVLTVDFGEWSPGTGRGPSRSTERC